MQRCKKCVLLHSFSATLNARNLGGSLGLLSEYQNIGTLREPPKKDLSERPENARRPSIYQQDRRLFSENSRVCLEKELVFAREESIIVYPGTRFPPMSNNVHLQIVPNSGGRFPPKSSSRALDASRIATLFKAKRVAPSMIVTLFKLTDLVSCDEMPRLQI